MTRDEEASRTSEAVTTSTGDFDFEQPTSTWTATGLTLAQSDEHVSGKHSAQVGIITSGGTLASGLLSSLGPIASVVKGQIRLPRYLAGQDWQGQVALRFNAPSIGLWDQYVGPTAFQNAPVGRFIPVQFALPAALVTALSTKTYDDLTVTIEFDFAPNPGKDAISDPFYIDALTFAATDSADAGADAGNGGSSTVSGGFSDAKLGLTVSKNLCQGNSAQDFFEAKNGDKSPIALSDISIKYWINDTSGNGVVPHVWYGGCVTDANGGCTHPVANVTASATPFAACGDGGAQANWEITVSTTDSTAVNPGFAWSHVQTAVNLADYSSFTPGTSTWFSTCGNGEPFAPDSHFAVYVKGNLVSANGVTPPSCRTPHGSQTVTGVVLPPTSPIVGRLPADTVLSLAVGLPIRNLAGLQARAAAAADPSSSLYRKWVGATELANNYLPSAIDYGKVVAWAQSKGFKSTTTANNVTVDIAGTVAQIENALFIHLITATRPDGSIFYTPDRIPSIDLDVTLLGISGLDNYVLPRRHASGGTAPIANSFKSSDFRGAYLGGVGSTCTGLTGAGQSIGIFTLDTGFSYDDIHAYEKNTGLTNVPEVKVQVSGNKDGLSSGCPTCTGPLAPPLAILGEEASVEESLDIEMATAMAPSAQVIVFQGNNPDQILQTIALNPQVSQASSSWWFGTTSLTPQLFTLIAAQGQSFFVASGDSGGYAQKSIPATATTKSCDPVSAADTMAMPFITLIGGTELNTFNGSRLSESSWVGSGGGIIPALPIPAYQVGANASNPGLSAAFRNAPDISMPSTAAYIVAPTCKGVGFPSAWIGQSIDITKCTGSFLCDDPSPDGKTAIYRGCKSGDIEGEPMTVGGTSEASPLFAGFMALVNEANKTLGPAGFINPSLYAIGKDATRYAASMNDVTGGTSAKSCDNVTFSGQVGYDQITGWGSPKCGIIKALANQHATLDVRSTADQLANDAVTVCGNGTGYTPGGEVKFTMSNIPGFNGPRGPITPSSVFADAAGNIKFNFSPFTLPGAINCPPSQEFLDVTVSTFDVASGVVATGKFPGDPFCTNLTIARDYNGGCP